MLRSLSKKPDCNSLRYSHAVPENKTHAQRTKLRFSVLAPISCMALSCIVRCALHGQQVLLLRGERFRAVDGEQRVALAHLLAGEIDEHLVDPAFQLGLHLGDAGFVQRHPRRGANGAR